LVCSILFCLVAVDSPKGLLRKGKEEEAIVSLNYISKFNRSKYVFDAELKICLTEAEAEEFRKSESISRDSSEVSTNQVTLAFVDDESNSIKSQLRELVSKNLAMVLLFAWIKIFVDALWFTNMYLLQKSS
jgi:hypothetical protein